MLKISAVIITFNEEKNISGCLKSLQGIADEIIVVDSFSTDKTEEICKSFNVKFIQHKFDGHIQQKNWAREQAKCELILSLDADEALDETLKQSILNIKLNTNLKAYKMNRLTNYCGTWIKHTGWYPDTKLRLWHTNDIGHWAGENPHDEFRLFDEKESVGFLKGDILHYSYHKPEDHDKQIEYFTTIASKAHIENGKSIFLMQEYFSAGLKFIKCYFIKLGFLDGKAGWRISVKSSYAAYLKYKKIRILKRENK